MRHPERNIPPGGGTRWWVHRYPVSCLNQQRLSTRPSPRQCLSKARSETAQKHPDCLLQAEWCSCVRFPTARYMQPRRNLTDCKLSPLRYRTLARQTLEWTDRIRNYPNPSYQQSLWSGKAAEEHGCEPYSPTSIFSRTGGDEKLALDNLSRFISDLSLAIANEQTLLDAV